MRFRMMQAGALAMLLGAIAIGCTGRPGEGGATSASAGPSLHKSGGAAESSTMKTEKAMFGAGCFWGVEERFRQTPGVVSTAVGYAGGAKEQPTYKEVCTDRTGHAEVVYVEFDPQKVGYEQLLDVFWKGHNPTTLNRQGPDFGSQYRSVIFTYSPQQEAAARASMERLAASGKYKSPIVTQIEPAGAFWRAEEYHQQYLAKRGLANCHVGDE